MMHGVYNVKLIYNNSCTNTQFFIFKDLFHIKNNDSSYIFLTLFLIKDNCVNTKNCTFVGELL